MASMSAQQYESPGNNLDKPYLLSPYKRLQDEQIKNNIEPATIYLNNLQSKHTINGKSRRQSQQYQEQQDQPSNEQAHKNNQGNQQVISPQRDSHKPWPRIFDDTPLKQFSNNVERIQNISPYKVSNSNHTQYNPSFKYESPLPQHQELKQNIQQQQQLATPQQSNKNKQSPQQAHEELNSQVLLQRQKEEYLEEQRRQQQLFDEQFQQQLLQEQQEEEHQLYLQQQQQLQQKQQQQKQQQQQQEQQHQQQEFHSQQNQQLIQDTPVRKHRQKIFENSSSPQQQQPQQYQQARNSNEQMQFSVIEHEDNTRENIDNQLLNFSSNLNYNHHNARFKRYNHVNSQMMGCLAEITELEQQQQQSPDNLKSRSRMLLNEIVKALDSQTLKKLIDELTLLLQELNTKNSKKQQQQQSQFTQNEISSMNLILSCCLEHSNVKLLMLIEDEEQDQQYFQSLYQKASELQLQLLPQQVVFQKLQSYYLPKDKWYAFICNQTQ